MEYKTSKLTLKSFEFGRNVQKMVEHLKTIEDKEERTQAAHAIVEVMGSVNQQGGNQPKGQQADIDRQLWDHLFKIADYDLDVFSPYPPPLPEDQRHMPEPLSYPIKKMKYRQYGKNIMIMIEKAKNMEKGTEKDELVHNIAVFMKMASRVWNNEQLSDQVILGQLFEMSGGSIHVQSIDISDAQPPSKPHRKSYKKHGGRKFYHKS